VYQNPIFTGIRVVGCVGYPRLAGQSPMVCLSKIPGADLAAGAAVANIGYTPANVALNLSDLTDKKAARGASGLGIENLTIARDANYTILPTDREVAHSALTAPRTDTLPAASSVNPGGTITVQDHFGVVTGVNTITIQPAGTDTINGGYAPYILSNVYGAVSFRSDGVSRWTYAAGAVSNVATDACLSGGPITTTGTLSANVAVNSQVGTSYSFVPSDKCKLVNLNNANPVTVTLPAATGAFGAGWYVLVQNIGVGNATITPTSGTIDGAASFLLPSGWGIRIVSDGTNYQVHGSKPLTGRVLLNKLTATSGVTTVMVDTTSITALFDDYEIVLENITPDTAGVSCLMRIHSNGAWQNTGYVFNAPASTTSSNHVSGAISNYIPCYGPGTGTALQNTAPGISGTIKLYNANSTTQPKNWVGRVTYPIASYSPAVVSIGGYWGGDNTPIDGWQIAMSDGTFSGIVKIYGMR
jgi:hypothetical protein